jgi:hypothetical protein
VTIEHRHVGGAKPPLSDLTSVLRRSVETADRKQTSSGPAEFLHRQIICVFESLAFADRRASGMIWRDIVGAFNRD